MNRSVTILVAVLLAVGGAHALVAECAGREVTVAALDNMKYLPQVAHNTARSEFFVVWHDRTGTAARVVKGARLDRFGRVISQVTISSGGARSCGQPTVAYDPVRDRYIVIWSQDSSEFITESEWDLRGQLVSWDGSNLGGSFSVWADSTSKQWNPKVAYSDTNDEYRVVWTNEPTAPGGKNSVSFGDLYATTGVLYYAQTVAGDATNHYMNPSIVYNALRNEYLVAYEVNQADIAARRMNSGGLVGSEITVASWPDQEWLPSVATCPGQDQWVVAWQSQNDPFGNVYVRFLQGDGTPGNVVPIATLDGDDQKPAIACAAGAARYLVAWEFVFAGALDGITGRVIGTNESFIGGEIYLHGSFPGQTGSSLTPAVVGSTIGWQVAWIQEREGAVGTCQDVLAMRVWGVFGDDFESGNRGRWSSSVP